MSQRERLIVEITQGMDYAAQVYFTDPDGGPLPIEAPARADVRDTDGVLVLQFDSGNDPTIKAAIAVTGSQGLLQISVPKGITRTLPLGLFKFDLFAQNDGGVSPFTTQEVPVVKGFVDIVPRTTRMEDPAA